MVSPCKDSMNAMIVISSHPLKVSQCEFFTHLAPRASRWGALDAQVLHLLQVQVVLGVCSVMLYATNFLLTRGGYCRHSWAPLSKRARILLQYAPRQLCAHTRTSCAAATACAYGDVSPFCCYTRNLKRALTGFLRS